jgi:hypothetical protein
MTKRGRDIRELHSAGGEKGGQILPDNMFHYHNFLFSSELTASFRLTADYSIFSNAKMSYHERNSKVGQFKLSTMNSSH